METGEALDVIGGLVSALKLYASTLPEVSPVVGPSGLKPAPEAAATYEQLVYRFRKQSGASAFRRLNEPLIESLEAFESGWVLRAVQALLRSLDQLELMKREQEITMVQREEERLREYRATLHKIMPGNEPELEGAGKGM